MGFEMFPQHVQSNPHVARFAAGKQVQKHTTCPIPSRIGTPFHFDEIEIFGKNSVYPIAEQIHPYIFVLRWCWFLPSRDDFLAAGHQDHPTPKTALGAEGCRTAVSPWPKNSRIQ